MALIFNPLKMTAFHGISRNESLKLLLIVVVYTALNQLSILFAFPFTNSIGVWFPAGFALGVLLLFGVRIWPAIALGALISGMLLFLHFGIPFKFETIVTIVLISSINTLEPLFANFLIRKAVKKHSPFKHASNVFLFLLITICTSFIGASLITLALATDQIVSFEQFTIYLFRFALSNLVAIFLITPLLISWSKPFRLSISRRILIESVLFVAALGFVLSSLTLPAIANAAEKSLPFLVMPFIFWLAFRANRQIITLCILILSIGALYITAQFFGPFALTTESESILILQIFLSIISITALVINATVQERSNAEKALKLFNEKLETRVKERTAELKEEINIRKSTEEKIKVSNKKLRKANTELDNFVYSVSHDLRAPIASVLGLVNLAKKEKDGKSLQSYLEMVAKSAQQQDAFIKDKLDLSRNSRLEVMQNDISFQEIVENIFDQYQYMDLDKQIKKNIQIDQKMPFSSDKSRIKVVLNNLISNAIRHSKNKNVEIDITIEVNEALASILVKDNGVGIGKEHLQNIFKMFYRGTDETAGSGLGLYIVNETIDKLRGAINIQSEINKGTVVKIELPNLHEQKEVI